MLILNVDRNKPVTIFEQLVGQIIELISSGVLNEGYIMPSTRELSEKMGINRSTIVKVYEELWSLGYLESTSGSYTKVRTRKKIVEPCLENNADEKIVENLFLLSGFQDSENFKSCQNLLTEVDDNLVNFQRLEPDSRLINRQLWNRCFREGLNNKQFDFFGYCNPAGYNPLRSDIKYHMRLHSINVNDNNILVTNGSQNSLHLIFQAFFREGDGIVIESPTYSMLIPLLKYYKLNVFEVPLLSDGMDLTLLKEIVDKENVKAVYTMPTFHNPTGITMSQKKREEMLHICEEKNIIIIEDSIEEEMKFFGKVHLPVKSMDSKGIVIYLGSFSKIFSPGLRIAWIVASDKCINQLCTVKTIFDLSTNTMNQIVLHNFMNSGNYETHIRKVMRVFKARMKKAYKILKTNMPEDKVEWTEPIGGFLIWLKINCRNKNIDFEEYFKQFGVLVSNGSAFYYQPLVNEYIRLSISKCNEPEIEEGIQRLAEGIKRLE